MHGEYPMKPSELLQFALEEWYFGKRILGRDRAYTEAPFLVAAITVDGDGCDGIEVSFWSAPPTPERLADGTYTDNVPKGIVAHHMSNRDELPEILPTP